MTGPIPTRHPRDPRSGSVLNRLRAGLQVEIEHQLGGARDQIVRLEERVRECEVIPGLRRELKQSRSQADQLRGKCKNLRVRMFLVLLFHVLETHSHVQAGIACNHCGLHDCTRLAWWIE